MRLHALRSRPPVAPVFSAIASYRPDSANHCPGCARSHWIVGRLTAECAFCGTAMPIATGAPPAFRWLANAA
ncbi:MAG: hypothetical protein RQ833_07150 [Sphingomonadaceae bacterium]|nr:hypothetical protein [Sphingomonadaceae bacterium]